MRPAHKLLLVLAEQPYMERIIAMPQVLHWWSADSVLWQDAARTTPATADGDRVGAIDDRKPGSIAYATAAADANRFTLNIDGMGRRALTIAATQALLTTAFQAWPGKRGCLFVSFAVQLGAATPTTIAATYNRTAPKWNFYVDASASKYKFYDGAQNYAAAQDVFSIPYVQQLNRTGDTTMLFYRDNALADTFVITDAQPSSNIMNISGNSAAPADFVGVFRDAIATSDISDAQRQFILTYLLTRRVSTAVGFGDSVTGGTGASDAAHRWLNLVNADAKVNAPNLVNSGLGGTTAQNTAQNAVAVIGGAVVNNGQDTVAARVNRYYPTRVFVLYGLNDLRLNDAAFTTATYQSSLQATVSAIIANGTPAAQIVIGSPPYMTPAHYTDSAPWNAGSTIKHVAHVAAARAVATALGTKYVDVYQYMLDNGADTLMSADGIHPNDAGHAAIAAAFLSVL